MKFKAVIDINIGNPYILMSATRATRLKKGWRKPMPVWFREALNKNPKARGAWEELIPSRKKEVLRYFSWLKSDEAKKRNLDKVMHVLSGKEGRFMARSWKNGK